MRKHIIDYNSKKKIKNSCHLNGLNVFDSVNNNINDLIYIKQESSLRCNNNNGNKLQNEYFKENNPRQKWPMNDPNS